MGRSQRQEGGHREGSIWSDHTPSRFPKPETYVCHYLYQHCGGVSDAIYRDIARLRVPSQEAHDSRSSSWCWSCLEAMIETVRECSSFSRVRQKHLSPLPQ
jgi:hypothetical protein